MKAFVSQLYSNGKSISSEKKIPIHVGDLNVSDGKHPILGRLCMEAVLLADNGQNAIQPLYDAHLIFIAAKGLRLRGFEVNAGRETAQEWWVRFELE